MEADGKRAVVVGMGNSAGSGRRRPESLGAAVAAVGGTMGLGLVQGVIRFVQVDAETCVIDGTLDGLSPGAEHGLAIHESGDFREGARYGVTRLDGYKLLLT